MDLDMLIVSNNFDVKNEQALQRVKEIRKFQKQLKQLLAVPKIVQKSEEWYKARENMISASDFAQALNEGKFGTQKQLIMKKCMPAAEMKSNPFFEWGNMFEPVACAIYSKMHSVKIHDFGLIKHPKLGYFGASPDGISELGIMLEIKCPMKRKIVPGGDVPTQYYYQIQGQLDVCKLEECDYFECEFGFYSNYSDFAKDTGSIRGIILKRDGCFLYSDPVLQNEDVSGTESWLEKNDDYDEMRCWMLKTYNMRRVKKDKVFLKEKLAALKVVWDRICYYRENPKALEIEINNSISIDTEMLNNEGPVLKGYLFTD